MIPDQEHQTCSNPGLDNEGDGSQSLNVFKGSTRDDFRDRSDTSCRGRVVAAEEILRGRQRKKKKKKHVGRWLWWWFMVVIWPGLWLARRREVKFKEN